MNRIVIAASFAMLSSVGLIAQVPGTRIPPRKDDHFQRNLTAYRVDMNEKINQPLVLAESREYFGDDAFSEKNGVVAALLNGLKSGKYLAHNPDDLKQTMTYDEVVAISQRINGQETDPDWDPENEPCFDCPEDEETDADPYFDNSAGMSGNDEEIILAPLESVLEFVSNRIFDKNRSDVVNDIQYIRLVWVDPAETLPDQNFVCIKYSDALEVLENTQWKNVHNDAEYRNMREIFELQLMNKFVTNVSGRGVRTLPESAHRTDQLTEFEHNVWSY